MKEKILSSDNSIQNIIYDIRGVKVMLDYDLASMYEVDVSQLKRQVRRNIDRFPEDFMFELTAEEVSALRCQNGILKPLSQFNNEVALQIEVINDALDQLREKKEEPDNPIGFKLQ